MIVGWSSCKAYGENAYALTATYSDALFDIKVDARGQRRAEVRSLQKGVSQTQISILDR